MVHKEKRLYVFHVLGFYRFYLLALILGVMNRLNKNERKKNVVALHPFSTHLVVILGLRYDIWVGKLFA